MTYRSHQERLKQLAEKLGFHETPELQILRREIIAADTPAAALLKYREYWQLGELVADQSGKNAEIQLGFNIAMARPWGTRGDVDRYQESLRDACEYAYHLGENKTAQALIELLAEA
jgi:hypothetical protein